MNLGVIVIKRVLHTPKNFRIGASPSDVVYCYTEYLFFVEGGEVFPSAGEVFTSARDAVNVSLAQSALLFTHGWLGWSRVGREQMDSCLYGGY